MLCAMCISIFATDPDDESYPTTRGQHHASIADVEAAAQQGCYLCSELILDYEYEEDDNRSADPKTASQTTSLSFELELHVISCPSGRLGVLSFESADDKLASAGYEIVYTEDIDKPQSYDDFLNTVKLDLAREPWRVRNDGFPSSLEEVPKSTGDPRVLKIAEKWLTRCLETHTKCKSFELAVSSSWYPKRLLDLSSGGKQRLIITEEEELQERYATLSHCWGVNPSICCLTANNLADWKEDIPTELLTTTFRDAIAATRLLKIRYLWIDSLCILQAGTGSKEDWQEHAVAMRLVYSHSLVNIAAARAESGADGAFASRADIFLRPCHVLWRWPSRYHNLSADSFWTIRKAERHQSFGIRTLPLYTRGWVVQERFLAPRVLHFGRDRIFWECSELHMVEESFPAGFQSSCPEYKSILEWPFQLADISQDLPIQSSKQESAVDLKWSRWQEMLNEYTRCDLSFPEKDIFIAVAGIAEKFGQYYDHQYIAGHFRQHLPFDLLWQNKGERPDQYRAPSWSWASIDGQVQFPVEDCTYCDACCRRFVTVKSASVALVNDEIAYGPVTDARLLLTGYLLPCRIAPITKTGTGLRQRVAIYWQTKHDDVPPPGPISNTNPSIFWGEADIDTEEDSLQGSALASRFTAWALPIIELKKPPSNEYARHWGLLLKQTAEGTYARLGIYRVRNYIMDKTSEQCTQQDVWLT